MDFMVSQEARRINLVAIYTMLPLFTADMVQKYMHDIGRLTFGQLDSYMYLKLSNNDSRFYSPTKIMTAH